MSGRIEVLITVLPPTVEENPPLRTACCQLQVESKKSLPRAPYSGTVRISGIETTITGRHPCRLLRHYTVKFSEAFNHGARYLVTVDLSDEWPKTPAAPPPTYDSYPSIYDPPPPPPVASLPQVGIRELAETPEVICKRIAGVFGRYCEEFRPPTVAVSALKGEPEE